MCNYKLTKCSRLPKKDVHNMCTIHVLLYVKYVTPKIILVCSSITTCAAHVILVMPERVQSLIVPHSAKSL